MTQPTPGAELFGRVCRLTVGDLQWSDLRVTFKIAKSLRSSPNPAEIEVFNLAEASRGTIRKRETPVRLVAGYGDSAEVIYAGQVVEVDHKRDGAAWCSKITCRTGDTAWRAYTSRNYAAKVPHAQVVADLCEDLGYVLPAKVRADLQALGTTRAPVVLHGHAHRELETVLRSLGFEWCDLDGDLQLTLIGKPTAETAVLLSPETGLLGSPEPVESAAHKLKKAPTAKHRPPGVKVVSLLQPGLRPGRLVQVQAAQVQGLYRVERVEHKGDTHGQDWHTTAECREV